MSDGDGDRGVATIFEEDEVREVLEEHFYAPPPSRARRRARRRASKKPDHYKVICISLYLEDLERLDARVKELKARGHRKMSRSALIRYALDTMDLDGLPRSL